MSGWRIRAGKKRFRPTFRLAPAHPPAVIGLSKSSFLDDNQAIHANALFLPTESQPKAEMNRMSSSC
jgi:hypothetical protein